LESKIEKKFSGPQTKRGLTKGADRNQATLSGICNSGHAITGFLIRNTPIRISNPAIGIVPDCKSRTAINWFMGLPVAAEIFLPLPVHKGRS